MSEEVKNEESVSNVEQAIIELIASKFGEHLATQPVEVTAEGESRFTREQFNGWFEEQFGNTFDIEDYINYSDIMDNIDVDDILYRMSDYELWEKVSSHIDYHDIASEVSDYLDIDDHIGNSLRGWADGGGCDDVGRIAWRGIQWAIDNGEVPEHIVILNRSEYERIMEVVNFIRPEVIPVPEPTNRDKMDEIVATMSVADVHAMLGVALADKAKRESEAVAEQLNGGESDGNADNN